MARYSRNNNNGLAVIILIGLIAIWQVITSIIGFIQGNLVYNQSQLENLHDQISKLRVTDRNPYNLHIPRISSYKKN
jgi:hypothetical protein